MACSLTVFRCSTAAKNGLLIFVRLPQYKKEHKVKNKILFLAAIKEEINFSCLEKYKNVDYLYTGIGKVNSTIVLMDYLSRIEKENFHIVNIGTCGSSIHKIGDIFSVSECCEYGCDFVSKNIRLTDISRTVPFCTKKDIVLSSDFFISTQAMSSKEFYNKTYSNFDMEAAALAKACEYYEIPFSSFKIISDDLTSDVTDWKKILGKLSPKAEDIVKSIIENYSHT